MNCCKKIAYGYWNIVKIMSKYYCLEFTGDDWKCFEHILVVKRLTVQDNGMRTPAWGIMPLCGCGWRDTNGRFHLPFASCSYERVRGQVLYNSSLRRRQKLMRGIDTQVRKTRRAIFREVANMAYHSTNLVDDMEALPITCGCGKFNLTGIIFIGNARLFASAQDLLWECHCARKMSQCQWARAWRRAILMRNIMSHLWCRWLRPLAMHVLKTDMRSPINVWVVLHTHAMRFVREERLPWKMGRSIIWSRKMY